MAKFLDKKAFTFDDFLLVPQHTNIESRQHVSLKTRFTRHFDILAPLVSANMDTITEVEMMNAMANAGCIGILHRFLNISDIEEQLKKYTGVTNKFYSPLCASIGINGNTNELLELYKKWHIDVVCIDIAHGDCERVIKLIMQIKREYPFDVIAGNVATAEATTRLCRAGSDAIKIGIGPGSMCSTRLVTGCGYPQLSAIIECSAAAKEYDVPVIADGGITKSGDIVKALAAGASSVMIGSLFAGTDETPGEVISDTNAIYANIKIGLPKDYRVKKWKRYRGMASADAMTGWKGNYHATPEGESKLIEYKGPVIDIVNELLGGVRSGFTYCNASNIEELQENAVFVEVSNNTLIENRPHGKI